MPTCVSLVLAACMYVVTATAHYQVHDVPGAEEVRKINILYVGCVGFDYNLIQSLCFDRASYS